MPSWSDSLVVFLGAGVGALGRFWISFAFASKSTIPGFPWATFIVNVVGSILIGVLMGVMFRQEMSGSWRVFLGVGVLGGFTTFSTFSWEAFQLVDQGRGLMALLYVLGSVAFGILGCWLAWSLARG
ncbi:MAG: fluoride efflux transporter CrcB [Fimbriimonadaceae bacterium]|nr:fluoride efflux transporter CrcB [Fimbriimonadaceae bacterium]